jgi:hypothetical protein
MGDTDCARVISDSQIMVAVLGRQLGYLFIDAAG